MARNGAVEIKLDAAMKHSTRRTLIIAAAAMAIACGTIIAWRDASRWSWGNSFLETASTIPAALVGRVSAYSDLAQGKIRLVGFGAPRPSSRVQVALKQQFGIELQESGAGCIVSSSQRVEWQTYNSVMLREIDRRFGSDAVDRVTKASEKPQDQMPSRSARRSGI